MARAWVADGPRRYVLVSDGTTVGAVRWQDVPHEGWAAYVCWGGLEEPVGVYAGEPGYAQRAVERRLGG